MFQYRIILNLEINTGQVLLPAAVALDALALQCSARYRSDRVCRALAGRSALSDWNERKRATLQRRAVSVTIPAAPLLGLHLAAC